MDTPGDHSDTSIIKAINSPADQSSCFASQPSTPATASSSASVAMSQQLEHIQDELRTRLAGSLTLLKMQAQYQMFSPQIVLVIHQFPSTAVSMTLDRTYVGHWIGPMLDLPRKSSLEGVCVP